MINNSKPGSLYIIATPIGNLQDITLRAIDTLKQVDLIACEDTRNTKNLLDHFEIKTPTISYFQHSKLSKIEYLIDELKSGKNIALVTDAGTPGISDPGEFLVDQIRNSHSERSEESSPDNPRGAAATPRSFVGTQDDNSIRVIPIPGPSALTAAASVSGMIEKDFYFAGFLPKKKGRQTEFKKFATLDCPIVIYESALRLERTLSDTKEYLGADTQVFIAREITKMFEEYWSGSVEEILSTLKSHTLKGEIVLVLRLV